MRILPDFMAKPILHNNRLFKVFHIKNIHSVQGKEIQGYFIVCPLLEISESKEDFILERLLEAGRFAARLGINILGLNSYISILPLDKEEVLTNKLKIPLTNGHALSAWSVIEAIYRVNRIKKIDLKRRTVAIIGATSSIGKLCAQKMLDYAQRVIINDVDQNRLKKLQELITNPGALEVIIERDSAKAARDADVIIISDYFSEMQDILEELKPDAIVYHLGKLENISTKATVIETGLIKLPYPIKLRLNTGPTKDIVSAALAETMLLTFEGKFTNYSWGDNINPERLEEIANIAVRHGFEVWVPEAPVL